MSVELFSNLTQTAVSLVATILAVRIVRGHRRVEYALCAGFLLAFALGILYWVTYQLLNLETPQIFYVADCAWVASTLFLLCLVLRVTCPQVKGYRHWGVYLPYAIALPLIVYFSQWGDVVLNILSVGGLAVCGHISLKELLYHKKEGTRPPFVALHTLCLLFMLTEYALWLASCFWVSDTMTNPYFWFDFALTIEVGCFLLAVKKGVAE